MVGLVIKKLPDHLHRRLKDQAQRNHRSMTKEVVALLEEALESTGIRELPPPYPIADSVEVTDQFINEAKREGRE